MFQLGALAADFNADLVEPFVKKSFISAFPNVHQPETRDSVKKST